MDVFMNSFVIACTFFLLCLNFSKANDCKSNPCQGSRDPLCICRSGIKRTLRCVNGHWRPLPCNIPTTPEPTCSPLPTVANTGIDYSGQRYHYHIGTKAKYICKGETNYYKNRYKKLYTRECTSWRVWDGEKPPENMCSCGPINVANQKTIYNHQPTLKNQDVLYPFYTTATFQCNNASLSGKATCKNTGNWEWTGGEPQKCKPSTEKTRHPHVKTDISKTATSKSPIHHTEQRTIVIVSGTTGAILGALIVLVVIVSCQRRIHYHRVRRARIRHRQDQDAFAAFITYHRDARLMLPSYDEAINQQEQGQPPSFEEALRHYEEPTISLARTRTSENPLSVSTESPTSSASPGSETLSVPENDSDRTATVPASTSENSRFFRSLRMLFGGRAFRPDAIYCRFVPDEDGSESQARREERGLENNAAEDEITEVLAQAGLY